MHLPTETDRLQFRPFDATHERWILETLNDNYARQFYPDISLDYARRWIAKNQERYHRDGFGLWVLELKESGEFIGDCGLTWQQVDQSIELEVGYHIHPNHRCCGYAVEAARACLLFGFEVTNAHRIVSLVHKKNVASQGVAEKIHQQRTETIRREMPHWVYFTCREDGSAESTD